MGSLSFTVITLAHLLVLRKPSRVQQPSSQWQLTVMVMYTLQISLNSPCRPVSMKRYWRLPLSLIISCELWVDVTCLVVRLMPKIRKFSVHNGVLTVNINTQGPSQASSCLSFGQAVSWKPPGLEIKFFSSREPDRICRSYLMVLCIETCTSLGSASLQNFKGAAGEFKGALRSWHPLISSPDLLFGQAKIYVENFQFSLFRVNNQIFC